MRKSGDNDKRDTNNNGEWTKNYYPLSVVYGSIEAEEGEILE